METRIQIGRLPFVMIFNYLETLDIISKGLILSKLCAHLLTNSDIIKQARVLRLSDLWFSLADG
jgi:hypothetical protein